MPRSAWVISRLPEPAGHQLGQGFHRLLRVGAVGANEDRAAALRGQHHDAHDALAVDTLAVLGDLDVGGELARQAHDSRRGTRMEPLLVDDGGLALDHRPTHRKTMSSRMASSAKRTAVRAGPNQRMTATPVAATASVPAMPAAPSPSRYQAGTSAIARPTA